VLLGALAMAYSTDPSTTKETFARTTQRQLGETGLPSGNRSNPTVSVRKNVGINPHAWSPVARAAANGRSAGAMSSNCSRSRLERLGSNHRARGIDIATPVTPSAAKKPDHVSAHNAPLRGWVGSAAQARKPNPRASTAV